MKLEDPKPLVSEVVEVENDLPPLLSDEAPGEEEKCQFCGSILRDQSQSHDQWDQLNTL